MSDCEVGVALSGSGLLLGAHIGALKAVEGAGLTIAEIAGTSGGAIIAASYAAGLTLDAMESLFLETDFQKLVPLNYYVVAIARLLVTKGLVSAAPLQTWLQTHLGMGDFSTTRIPCTIVASNLTAEASQIWSTSATPGMAVWQAVLASAAFPVVFPPVQIGSSWLQDGGLYDDIPVDLLTRPRKLAVVVNGKPTSLVGTPNLIGLLMRDIETLSQANRVHVLANAVRQGAAIAYVESPDTPIFDTALPVGARQGLIAAGFQAASEAIKVWSGVG